MSGPWFVIATFALIGQNGGGVYPPYWICTGVTTLHPGTKFYVPNLVLSFQVD